MVKSVYHWFGSFFSPSYDDIPKPPQLPEYEPGSEKVHWDRKRLSHSITDLEGTENWPPTGDIPKEDDKPDWRGVIRKNVIELPMPGKYGFGQRQDTNYFFFDTPDYADPFKKLWWSNKFFLKTGLLFYSLLGIYKNRPFTWENNMWLLKRTLKPWYIGGMVGTLAVLTISNLRGKKDDYINYGLAGFLAGSYLGRENHVKWFRYTMIWTPMAVIVKHVVETNGILVPHDHPGRWRSVSLSANDAEHGFFSGDLRPEVFKTLKDPGRDQRTIAH